MAIEIASNNDENIKSTNKIQNWLIFGLFVRN